MQPSEPPTSLPTVVADDHAPWNIAEIVAALRAALFPTHHGSADLDDESIDYFVDHTLHGTLERLAEQVRRSLFFASDADDAHDAELRRRAAAPSC